jgi:DHA1 family multidrug resistance protein-like MFS transporter
LAGAGFPLFSQYMFAALHVNWAGTLLGCVALCLVPIPVCFYIYGAKIRQRSAFAPTKPLAPPSDEEEPPLTTEKTKTAEDTV